MLAHKHRKAYSGIDDVDYLIAATALVIAHPLPSCLQLPRGKGLWTCPVAPGLWNELEGGDVSRPNNAEVATIESREGCDSQPLRSRDDRRVDGSER